MTNFEVTKDGKMFIKIFTVHPDYKELDLEDRIYVLDILYDWVINEKIKATTHEE